MFKDRVQSGRMIFDSWSWLKGWKMVSSLGVSCFEGQQERMACDAGLKCGTSYRVVLELH